MPFRSIPTLALAAAALATPAMAATPAAPAAIPAGSGAGIHPMMKVETVGFDATATFRRSDFGIATFLPMIADPVSLIISAEFQLTK